MNHIKLTKTLFLIFIFLFSYVFAQQNSNDSSPDVAHPAHPSVVIIIGVLCTMFCLSFLILACMKFFNSDFTLQVPHVIPSGSRSRVSGIDKKAIESLPLFRFSSLKGSKDGLECVVCLSKFEDSELLRLLPKCRHAFHMKCIDQWLESHSTCPLCRYNFDWSDVTTFAFTNSLRYTSSLDEGLNNLEIFVKREQDGSSRSSRFSLGGSFRKFVKSPKEDGLIQHGGQKLLDKFKHRIIVSDIVCKSRWSDVSSSDFMFLNAKMLNEASSKRFSPSSSGRFEVDIEQVRRLHEFERGETSVSASYCHRFAENEVSEGIEKRSMSEITNVSRFRESRSLYWSSCGKDDELQRVWLPMAKRTIEWFTNRERKDSL
ncbi:hypothetical protein R6Q59_024732 [Mikania micrantha]